MNIHQGIFINMYICGATSSKRNETPSGIFPPFVFHLVPLLRPLDIPSPSLPHCRSHFNTLNLQQIADNNSHMALNRNKLRGHIATQPYGKKTLVWNKSENEASGKKSWGKIKGTKGKACNGASVEAGLFHSPTFPLSHLHLHFHYPSRWQQLMDVSASLPQKRIIKLIDGHKKYANE